MKFSDDHRKHLSEMRTGKRHSVKTRLFLSTLNRGKKNWNWNPNRSDGDRAKRNREYVEYNFWREDVFKRDEYTCQNCMKGGKLCAHHIESFADNIELRIDLSNGITLCKKCHVNFHHLYGYGKNTREHLNDFLGIQNLKQATGGA